jgi:hypothetical protein
MQASGQANTSVRRHFPFNAQVFLFEFKVVELNPAGAALQQIKDMR